MSRPSFISLSGVFTYDSPLMTSLVSGLMFGSSVQVCRKHSNYLFRDIWIQKFLLQAWINNMIDLYIGFLLAIREPINYINQTTCSLLKMHFLLMEIIKDFLVKRFECRITPEVEWIEKCLAPCNQLSLELRLKIL